MSFTEFTQNMTTLKIIKIWYNINRKRNHVSDSIENDIFTLL